MPAATSPLPTLHPPTLEAARTRIAAVRPGDYARTRNALDGAVSGLSPYITHGIVTLPEVLAGVVTGLAAGHRLDVQHKFVFELGWREFFRHVWAQQGDGIFTSLHDGPLPEYAYAPELPADVRQARTGVPVVDTAVRTLYATGTLHNHARMWLASYVVHVRKVHWRAGADWLYAHLLDGDLASNHLSWQWVAGTGSHKPYLFNAENVARYAPADWHSPGTVVDTGYEALDAVARSPCPVPTRPVGDVVAEPAVFAAPPAALSAVVPDPAAVAGRDVWIVHPWALREPPADLPADALRLGVWIDDLHRAWPWSGARWAFAGTRMASLAPLQWRAGAHTLAQALRGARSVRTVADPHIDAWLGMAQRAPAPQLFADADRPCSSFSAWWNRVTRGVRGLGDLPGLAGLSAGPLFDAPDVPTEEPAANSRGAWHNRSQRVR
jgi:deoxyribodipyrimidine photo-lyase